MTQLKRSTIAASNLETPSTRAGKPGSGGGSLPRPVRPERTGLLSRTRRDAWLGVAMVAPALLLVFGVYVYPVVLTLIMSFARVDIATFSIERYVGLANYIGAFANDAFVASLGRTIYFAVLTVFLTLVVSFSIALLLNQSFPGRNWLRVLVTLPWAVPPVVSGVLWGQMFHESGFLNAILYQLGFQANTVWLGNPTLAFNLIILAEIWRFQPFATLFMLAGLQNIPESVMEAASIDGAGVWQRFRHITLPLVAPVVIPVLAVQFTWAMKAFDSIFVLTRGGPGKSTTTLNYWVYQEGFEFFNLGRASASAYILLLLIVTIVATSLFVQKRMIRGWAK